VFHRRLNAVLLAVLAYLLSAWFFTFIVFCVTANAGRADQSWHTILLAAPAAVPMLLIDSSEPFIFVWLLCILGGAVVFFRVLRRWLMPAHQAGPSSEGPPPPAP
jgi:hypothetical protein